VLETKLYVSDVAIWRNAGAVDGFSARDLNELFDVVEQNQALFMEAWNEYFG